MELYLNIDYSNLMMIHGDTPEKVEAKHDNGGTNMDNGGKFMIFRNIKEMKLTLRQRGEDRKKCSKVFEIKNEKR